MRYQSMRESLEHVKAEYHERCTNCGLCVEVCPVYQIGDWGGLAPEKLHEGRLAAVHHGVVSDDVYNFTFACSNCVVCKDSCPDGLDPFEFTRLTRMAIVDSGRAAPANLAMRLPSRPDSPTQVSAALQVKPGAVRWLAEVPENPPQADTVLFLGCNIHAMPDKIHTLMDILATLGLNVPVVGGIRICCGELDVHCGDVASAERSLRQLVQTLARFRPREVVYWCGGCYDKVMNHAPAVMDVPFRSRHVAAFLLDHLGEVTFPRQVEQTVTVHDPCTLARMVGEHEPVRRLLAAIPGVALVEMSKNRAEARCCGSPTNSVAPELAPALTERALAEARATGATALATICHGCQRRFARSEPGQPFRVESFITLLGEALGIVHEDRLKRYVQYRDPERVIAEAADYIAAADYPPGELERLVRLHFR